MLHNKTILEQEEEQQEDIINDDDAYYLTDATAIINEITRLLEEPLDNDHQYLSNSVDPSHSCRQKKETSGVAHSGRYASHQDESTAAAFQQQSGIQRLLFCSSSSLHMYHQRLPSTSTSTCSSYTSRMMLLDEGMIPSAMNTTTTTSTTTTSTATTSTHSQHESILMKQALKQTQQRKRRESIGEVVTTRKRQASTFILPRLTKSSILQTNPNNHERKRSLSNLHKNNNQRNYYSLQQPLSQYERNKLASLEPSSSSSASALASPPTPSASSSEVGGVHWDPHIDAFEILRAKITGITRSMQEFHVQELFHDEILRQKKRRQQHAVLTMPSSTLSCSPSMTGNSRQGGGGRQQHKTSRRLSLANLDENNSLYLGHRRIRSQSAVPNDREEDDNNNKHEEDETSGLGHFRIDPEDVAEERLLKSPSRTALFSTTNSLISSRLDELSETASAKSSMSHMAWQNQFFSLVTNCIHQSEALESLSTDVLYAEDRVRELMLVNDTLHEQFCARERQYEERIRECQHVAHQQSAMIDSLEELTADINMKMASRRREMNRQETAQRAALDANTGRLLLRAEQQENERWSFQKSVSDLLHLDDKYDLIQKMRWEIGMFVGGGVGTGHVIHSYQDELNGIDIMIAGTGTTTTPHPDNVDDDDDDDDDNDEYNSMTTDQERTTSSRSISQSVRHIRLYQHQYILHLTSRDRQTSFSLLPKCLWIPDHETNQCQFQHTKGRHAQCSTTFSFFQRKHHCRKCGSIVCQRHSANRLPLFNGSNTGQWSRVCDYCFYDLIVHK